LITDHGTIFVGTFPGHSGTDASLFAINPNGTLKWSYHNLSNTVEGCPTIGINNTVYVVTYDDLYAFDAETGDVKWRFHEPQLSPTTTVVGVDGTVYFGSDDMNLYAFDGLKGTLKWKFTTGGVIDSTPAIGDDGTVYFGSWDQNFYAIEAESGSLKWNFSTRVEISSSPALGGDGTVYFSSENFYALDGATGNLKWNFSYDLADFTDPAIAADGNIYVADFAGSHFYALGSNGKPC